MPNGTSGGFRVTRTELQAVLETHPSTTLIAKGLHSGGTVSEVLDVLASFPDDEVIIEQQDRSWYIIWLDPAFRRGLDPNEHLAFIVDEESPIFLDLVDRHKEWLESLEDAPRGEGSSHRAFWLFLIPLVLGGLILLLVLLN